MFYKGEKKNKMRLTVKLPAWYTTHTKKKGGRSVLQFTGIFIAVAGFLLIGIFHPIVIKAEYYFSSRCWPVFLLAGSFCLVLSLFIQNIIGNALMGILGCSLLWSIRELKQQEKRVERGWFPKNPKRGTKKG
jgi:hypothetical protein